MELSQETNSGGVLGYRVGDEWYTQRFSGSRTRDAECWTFVRLGCHLHTPNILFRMRVKLSYPPTKKKMFWNFGGEILMESSSDVMLEMRDVLGISPMQELVMWSAGRSFVWGAICIPPTSVPDEGEIDIPSNEEKDVLNILKKEFWWSQAVQKMWRWSFDVKSPGRRLERRGGRVTDVTGPASLVFSTDLPASSIWHLGLHLYELFETF